VLALMKFQISGIQFTTKNTAYDFESSLTHPTSRPTDFPVSRTQTVLELHFLCAGRKLGCVRRRRLGRR
jgi:hypothetical protein